MIDLEKYSAYKYSAIRYMDSEETEAATIFYEDDDCVIAIKKSGKIHVLYATNDFEAFLMMMPDVLDHFKGQGVYIEFVPRSYVADLEKLGFAVCSEFADFWIRDIKEIVGFGIQTLPQVKIIEMSLSKSHLVSDITMQCKGQSRGFDGEPAKALEDWIEDFQSKIFVAEVDQKPVATLMTRIYGQNHEKGPVVWIRLLAVLPKYQRRGIGEALLQYGLAWGRSQGARRSFLHADVHNDGAIKMYQRNGFEMADGDTQINMLL